MTQSPQVLFKSGKLGDPFARHQTQPFTQRVEKKTCKWCWQPITEKRRREWCSQACIDEYMGWKDAGRWPVFRRDQGICAECGLDTEWLKDHIFPSIPTLTLNNTYKLYSSPERFLEGIEKTRLSMADYWDSLAAFEFLVNVLRPRLLELYPWAAKLDASRSFWDCDHIKPVVLGGGNLGMENLRTLCLGCHKAVTKALAGMRARLPNKTYRTDLK